MAETFKTLPAMHEIQVGSLVWEDPLEKEMATQSSILPWKTAWTGSVAGYSPWGLKELDTTERLRLSLSSLGYLNTQTNLNYVEGNAISLLFLVLLFYCQLVIHF